MPRDHSTSVPRPYPDNVRREEDFLATHDDAVMTRERPNDAPPIYTGVFRGKETRSQDLGRVLDAMEAACGGTPECKCPAVP
jgi:hypothetical protein